MQQAGIAASHDLKSFRYTGSHPATAQAVAAGVCDAGAIDETVYEAMLADGRIDGDKLRVFHTTAPFADYVWVARNNLAPALQEKVARSEEHTSELQSLMRISYAVFCLKKKKNYSIKSAE